MEKTPAFVLQPCICYMILGKAEALPRNLIYLIHGHALTLLMPKGRGFSVQRLVACTCEVLHRLPERIGLGVSRPTIEMGSLICG